MVPPLLGILVYVEVLGGFFQSDDFWHVAEVARRGITLGWGAEHGFLRPVSGLCFLLDHTVWGLRPFGYHLTNVLLHAASCLLLLVALGRFLGWCGYGRAFRSALASAVLFAVLPAHSEPVGWISGRTDLLAAAFGLAATVFLIDLARHPSWGKALPFVVLGSACLLSKESAVAFPLIWVVLALAGKLCRRERLDRAWVAATGLSLLLLALYLLARRLVVGTLVGGYGTALHTSVTSLDAFLNLFRYAWRSLLPAVPKPWMGSVAVPLLVGTAAGMAAALVAALRRLLRGGRGPGTIAGLALLVGYVISVLPVLSMGISLATTESERLLYLPSALAVSCIGLLLARIFERRWALTALTAVLACGLAAALIDANHNWRTASELARRVGRELSAYDPARTLVLNVPDNYRGAYVARHGLTEAATLFQDRPMQSDYQVLLRHDVSSVEDRFDLRVENGGVRLSFPAETELFIERDLPAGAQLSQTDIYVPLPPGLDNVDRLVGFRGGARPPVLAEIERPPGSPHAKGIWD